MANRKNVLPASPSQGDILAGTGRRDGLTSCYAGGEHPYINRFRGCGAGHAPRKGDSRAAEHFGEGVIVVNLGDAAVEQCSGSESGLSLEEASAICLRCLGFTLGGIRAGQKCTPRSPPFEPRVPRVHAALPSRLCPWVGELLPIKVTVTLRKRLLLCHSHRQLLPSVKVRSNLGLSYVIAKPPVFG